MHVLTISRQGARGVGSNLLRGLLDARICIVSRVPHTNQMGIVGRI